MLSIICSKSSYEISPDGFDRFELGFYYKSLLTQSIYIWKYVSSIDLTEQNH